MMAINSSKHIINKVFIEVNTNSKEKGHYLKDNINAFLQKEIFSVLENYFDAEAQKKPYHSLQLERLDLEIAVNPNLNFVDFKQQVLINITKQIEEVFGKKTENTAINSSFKLISGKEKRMQGFLYFLETGTNAWWGVSEAILEKNGNEKFQEMIANKAFTGKLVTLLEQPIARTRFIKQFDNEQILMLIRKVARYKANTTISEDQIVKIEKIKKNIEKPLLNSKPTLAQRNLIWEIVLLCLLNKNETITKQKVFQLIYSVLEFNQNIDKQIVTKQINNQIKTKLVFELVSNLKNEILIIDKSVNEKISTASETLFEQSKQKNEEKNELVDKKNTLPIDKNGLDEIRKTKKDSTSDFKKNNNPKVDNKNPNEMKNTKNDNLLFSKKNNDSFLEDCKDNEKKSQFMNNNNDSINEINEPITDYFVENAGLIIIHPFLKHLFYNCKLLNNDNTINNPEIAAHLLHYIATGREQEYEHLMIFEKFLCDIPINMSIDRNIILSKKIKKEAQEVLKAALNNWEVLKKSSVKLLQNEFLQRQGKMILIENENPKIIIERKTQDILLDRLDWNLSIIKLAWKKNIIYVDW